MHQYYRDTEDFRSFAAQVPAAEKATTSVVGGVLGADSRTAVKGAGVGALTGGIKGTSSGCR
ncbi:MAG: hypothetical protein ACI89Z_000594 [Porticoccus sp.]|jgi:hypothetical protein